MPGRTRRLRSTDPKRNDGSVLLKLDACRMTKTGDVSSHQWNCVGNFGEAFGPGAYTCHVRAQSEPIQDTFMSQLG